MTIYPDPDFIGSTVVDYLAKNNVFPNTTLQLSEPVQLKPANWSVVFFLTLSLDGYRKTLVAKIPRYPEQERGETSWESEDLLDRGYREFDSLLRIYEYFQTYLDDRLGAVRPLAFLPEINALVMDYVDGQPFYDNCMGLRQLTTPKRRKRTKQLMYRTGQWLSTFHDLTNIMGDVFCDRVSGPSDSYAMLLEMAQLLGEMGVETKRWTLWEKALGVLQRVDSQERVWIHSDFHMRNVFVQADDSVLSLDTALDRQDNRYIDISKFLADMRTRRSRILNFGSAPSTRRLQALREEFLKGYFQNQEIDTELLLLYEGRFILEKWEDSLVRLQDELSGKASPIAKALRYGVIEPTFHRITRQWMQAVLDQRPIW